MRWNKWMAFNLDYDWQNKLIFRTRSLYFLLEALGRAFWSLVAHRKYLSLELWPDWSVFPYILRVSAKAELIQIGSESDLDPYLAHTFKHIKFWQNNELPPCANTGSHFSVKLVIRIVTKTPAMVDMRNCLRFIWSSYIFVLHKTNNGLAGIDKEQYLQQSDPRTRGTRWERADGPSKRS